MLFPSRSEAEKIWQNGIDFSREHKTKSPQIDKEYIFHTTGVARFSERLAAHLKLNEEQAYVCGLLHDYGKRLNERQEDRFHGLIGYDDMLELGYPQAARICLTHSFIDKNFSNDDFSYPDHWLNECRNLLKSIEYNEYDLIAQYCDLFFEGMEQTTLERRIAGIAARYNINDAQRQNLEYTVFKLKKQIDKLCDCDSYKILGIA